MYLVTQDTSVSVVPRARDATRASLNSVHAPLLLVGVAQHLVANHLGGGLRTCCAPPHTVCVGCAPRPPGPFVLR
jgi:hypothetical protein